MPRNSKELSKSRSLPGGGSSRHLDGSQSSPTPTQTELAKSGSSFAARFGRVILQHGIAAIPSALYHFQGRLGLTAQQVWFVSYILAHKWAEALPHPSLNKMAHCTGVERRVLQYRCVELANLGLLQIEARYGEKGDQETNYFDFSGLFEKLEAILIEEQPAPNPIRDRGDPSGSPTLARLEAREPLLRTSYGDDLAREADVDYSFLARYGRVLLRYGIAAVPKALFTHQRALGLTPQEVWFVCYILSFQWDAALPYPSINKMAERTGYSKRQLLRIKDELVAATYLTVVRRTSSDHGNDTNAYDFSPLLEAIRRQLQQAEDGVALSPDLAPLNSTINEPEEHVDETPLLKRRSRPAQPRHRSDVRPGTAPIQRVNPSQMPVERSVTRGVDHVVTNPVARNVTTPIERQVTRGIAQEVPSRVEQGVTSSVAPTSRAAWNGKSQGGQKRESPKVEAPYIETFDEDDSNRRSLKIGVGTGESPLDKHGYSTYIAAVMTDFSDELGDTLHVISNVSQALRLWEESGQPEKEFVDLMYLAKGRTRLGQGMQGSSGLTNKMAYFFTVLRRLITSLTD